MNLFNKIKQDRIESIKNKETIKKNLLGVLQGDCSKDNKNPSDQEVIDTIKSFLKKNKELQEKCEEKGNTVGIAAAQVEVEILQAYLPKQLSEEGIETGIKAAINLGATDIKGIQAFFRETYPNRYDAGLVTKLAKDVLNG